MFCISIVDIVHQNFWSIDDCQMKSRVFLLVGSFVSVFLVEKRADPLLLWDFLGRIHGRIQKVGAKEKKRNKKGLKEVVAFVLDKKILTLIKVDKE